MAVEGALRSGRITRDSDGQIDFEKADHDWALNTRPHAPRGIHLNGGDEEDEGLAGSQYTKARAARELYQYRLAKLEYQERIGKLVSKEEMEIAAFNQYRQFRDRMLNIPDRLAAILAAQTDAKKCHEVLVAEIHRALDDFANCDS
jgi:hypothetical protein